MTTTDDFLLDRQSPNRSFSVGQVAEKLAVRPATVRKWLRENLLTGYKINGRDWRVTEESLIDFINGRHG